jgi:hypothetical protein
MKPPVPENQKSKGVTFSLKPDLYRALEQRVENLGYPWTKSSYVASLVMKDLEAAGMLPEGISSTDSEKALAHAKKAVENTKRRQQVREGQKPKKPDPSKASS